MAEQLGTLDVAVQTDIGRKRKRNEDYYDLHIPEPGSPQHAYGALFVVADGMGGMGGGDAASQTAVRVLFEHYYTERSPHITPLAALKAALEAANVAVRQKAREIHMSRIGTTAAGVLLLPNGEALIFNVGDARVYRVRQGFIEQLSHDQSVLQHQIDAGLISAEQARQARNVNVTAFLGQPTSIEAVHRKVQVQPGDVFLLCSDGLWDLVTPHEMLRIVEQYTAEQATRRLIELALKRGAPDNVTVLVLRIGTNTTPRSTRKAFWALPILLVALAAVIWFAFAHNNKSADAPILSPSSPANTSTPEKTTTLTAPTTTAPPNQAALISVFTDTPSPTPDTSATPTPSATATPSVPPSATPSHTATSTATLTPTPTVTFSATPTSFPTPSATHTPRPSVTHTPTSTPSATYTATLTPTPHPPTATLNPNVISPTPTMSPTVPPTLSPRELTLQLASTEGVRLSQDAVLLFFQGATLQTPPSSLPLAEGTLVQLTSHSPMTNPQNPAMVLREVQVMEGDLRGQIGWLPQEVLETAQPLIPLVVCQAEAGCHVRAGDGTNYPIVGGLSNGESARVQGRSSTGNGWLAIVKEDGTRGWIAPFVVITLGNTRDAPVMVPPPSPMPSDTPTPASSPAAGAG